MNQVKAKSDNENTYEITFGSEVIGTVCFHASGEAVCTRYLGDEYWPRGVTNEDMIIAAEKAMAQEIEK